MAGGTLPTPAGSDPTRSTGEANQRRAERLELIALVARKRFATLGYDGTSLQAIADNAGVPVQWVQNYAGSKADLFVAYYRHRRHDFLGSLAAAGEAAEIVLNGPAAQFERGIECFLRFVDDDRAAWALIHRRGAAGEQPFAAELTHARSELSRLLAQILAEGRATVGNPTVVNTEMTAHGVMGAVEAAALWWLDHDEMPVTRLARELTDVLWSGLEEQFET